MLKKFSCGETPKNSLFGCFPKLFTKVSIFSELCNKSKVFFDIFNFDLLFTIQKYKANQQRQNCKLWTM